MAEYVVPTHEVGVRFLHALQKVRGCGNRTWHDGIMTCYEMGCGL